MTDAARPEPPFSALELDTFARTIWAEARGEGVAGMRAVAAVIVNRARRPRWWGKSVRECCLKPAQFSCWNPSDPNYRRLMAVTSADPQFALALGIAELALRGNLPDPTNGSDSYANLALAQPAWATKDRFRVKIGNHSFFQVERA